MVDKDFDPGPFDADGPELLSLIDEMSEVGYDLTEFTVGPVDVISSRVGLDILDHSLIKAMVSRYQGMVLPLALLSDTGLPELCEKLNSLLAGKRIKIATPFPLTSVHNQKHINLIRERVQFIIARMPDVKFELLYLTVNMVEGFVDKFDEDLIFILTYWDRDGKIEMNEAGKFPVVSNALFSSIFSNLASSKEVIDAMK